MAKITENETRGMNTPYAGNSGFNATDTQIHDQIQSKETIFLANIKKLHTEEEKGATYVNAQPILKMVDANGDTYDAPTYEMLPHYRVQAGIAALIIDPTDNDIGVFACAKRDISNVTQGNHDPQQPASFRGFSASDAIQIGTIHTKTPTTFIHLRQAENCHWVIPEGVLGETNKDVQWEVGRDVIQHIDRDRTETIGRDRTVSIENNDTLTVGNNQTEYVGANKKVTIIGNCDVTIMGNATVDVTGYCHVTSATEITLKAPLVTIDAPLTRLTGHLEVGGLVHAGVKQAGTHVFNNIVWGTSDVYGADVSLVQHIHEGFHGPTSSPLPTGTPPVTDIDPDDDEGTNSGQS